MGSLKKLRLPTADIDTPGGVLTVRGVSLRDVAALVRHHGPVLATLFREVMSGRDVTLNLESLSGVFNEAITTAPELVSDLICLASGELDNEAREIARCLPFPVQLEAVEKIAGLTFTTEGALGKLMEIVARLAEGANEAMTDIQKPSINGSAISAHQ